MTKPLVIKIGGAILENKSALTNLLTEISSLKRQKQTPIIIVHGGGCVVDDMLSDAGFTTEKKNGLRVTPLEQMPIIGGALAGFVNKTIVAQANELGLNAIGLSLTDGNMVQCKLHPLDLGAVGIPTPNSSKLLDMLLQTNFLPIISSIGALTQNTSTQSEISPLVNVNADDAAVVICQLLNAELLLLTDVNGVKDASGNYLTSLSSAQAKSLISDGVIAGGMTAKVNAALTAANQLRRSIVVASWQSPKQIFAMLAGDTIGTRILPDS